MSKHTKGPWTFTKDGYLTITDSEGGEIMGQCFFRDYVPEKLEDWLLITAAPELLDALQELVGLQSTDPDSAVSRARAAIAKATGAA